MNENITARGKDEQIHSHSRVFSEDIWREIFLLKEIMILVGFFREISKLF